MWPFTRKPLIDVEMVEWMLDHGEWLLAAHSRRRRFAEAQLIPIADRMFPKDGHEGHALAEHILRHVLRYMGLSDLGVRLVADESAGRYAHDGNRYTPQWQSMPVGTYSAHFNEITYDPGLLRRPVDLVAVLSHEVSHAVLELGAHRSPPSDPDFDELLTDFTAIFLGFGLFQIAYRQPPNPQTLESADAARSYYTYYMSRREACTATALFAAVHDVEPAAAVRAADMDARSSLKRAFRDMDAHRSRIGDIRQALLRARNGG